MRDTHRQTRLTGLVRKLLELSRRSSNPHEAGLALQRARTLMEKYGITAQEADLSSVREAASTAAPSEAESVPVWMTELAWLTARAFGCRPYYSWRETASGDYRRNVTFYGFGERPSVAAYAFDVLTRQLKTATADYLKTQRKTLKLTTRRARADQFRAGWVSGVHQVITAFYISEQESRLMTQWLESRSMRTITPRNMKLCRGDDIARGKGYEAGQSARLHQGLDGAGQLVIDNRN